MSPDSWRLIFLVCYFAVYLSLVVGGISYLRWARKTKWPFKEGDRLLRGPGEGLRRQIAGVDGSLAVELGAAIMAALISWPVWAWLMALINLKGWLAVIGICIGMLTVALVSVWRIGRLWQKRANLYLGWFGERITAEKLRPLQLQGYRVFHDMPCASGKAAFNIDHVVVGATGVAIVEVKTRRKGNARLGYKDHEVKFDGSQLDWPAGYDRKSVQQAINEADWLGKWIYDRTGLKTSPKAVLTIPGWMVHESPSLSLRVVNPSFLPDAIRGRGEAVLTAQQVDLIARQLEERCRDVED
jgi:hypothetical protein